MRRFLAVGVIVFGVAPGIGCAAPDSVATTEISTNSLGPGVLLEVNTRGGTLSTVGSYPNLGAPSVYGPNLSILDGEAIGIEASNYSVSTIGAHTPGMVRVRFDVRLTNHLSGTELAPPNLAPGVPEPDMLMLLPFLQQADAGAMPIYTGSDPSIITDDPGSVLVRPSDDWGGGGALGAAGYDFTLGRVCVPLTPGCSRWEAYAPLAPGTSSGSQVVGFDVAPTVGRFRVRLLLLANLRSVDGDIVPSAISTGKGR